MLLLALCAVFLARSTGAEELSVVSYNVHGLTAWIARDDPETRMPVIGRLLTGYDVALVQEDWSHHAPLAESTGYGIKLLGSGPRSALLGRLSFLCGSCGSGLAFFAAMPLDRLVESAAEPYGVCSDWIVSGNDCWATKGFLFARLRLASGAEIDVYDTHLEAGSGTADLEVRERQLDVLRAFVKERSESRAVILGGDLNMAYDDPREREAVERFAGALGLRDTGARQADLTRWQNRLDWILYRETAGVGLSVVEAGEDLTFVRDGAPLSDHPAVFARFRVERRP